MEFLRKNVRLLLGAGGLVFLAGAVLNVPVDDATADAIAKVVGVVGGAVVAGAVAKWGKAKAEEPKP